jgi:hypothetical protein
VSFQQAFCAAVLDAGLECPPGLTTWNRSDPGVRFAVYRNNVVVSLVAALAEAFPVTQRLVGDEFFAAMARLYVAAFPPKSPVLALCGDDFPAFIEAFEPARAVPYLADVARLEALRVRAYHAADAVAMPAQRLADLLSRAELLPQLRLRLHPSVGVLRSAFAVVSLWAAHHGLLDIAQVDPFHAERALVLRNDLDVEVIGLSEGAQDFIEQLGRGAPLATASAFALSKSDRFDLAATLAILIGHGALADVL